MWQYTLKALRILRDRLWVPDKPKDLQEKESSPYDKECESDGSSGEDPPEEEVFKLTAKHAFCFSIIGSGMILVALDYAGMGNIMSQISADLKGTTNQSEWIGNGYALAACVVQLPISSLSDIFGRRNLYMASLVLFMVGSIVSATAHNMEALIAGRVIQGAGGAGLLVLPEVMLADIVPLRQRSMYYCFFMLIWCAFTGSAPLIAGALTEYSTWRWFFYLNLFVGGFAFVLCPIGVKLKSDSSDHWKEKLKTIDYIGAVLIVGSTTSLLFALSRGGSSRDLPWSDWTVIFPLVLGCVGIIATGIFEHVAKPKFPMFNYRVFGNLSSSLCYIQNVLQGIVNMGLVYFLPTFFQGAKGYSELVSGACVLPLQLVGPPFAVFFGWLIERIGHYHFVNLLMWGLSILGSGVMILMNEHRGIGGLIMLQFPVSLGISSLYATLSTTANATNPPNLWTDSTAMMSFCRSIGDSLGTAIGGAVFATHMREKLTQMASNGVQVPESVSLLSIVSVIKATDDPNTKEQLVMALTGTMQTLFIVMTAFCAAGFVTTLMQKEYTLDQAYESKQGIDL